MKISILTVFEQLYKPFLATSLVEKAQEKKILEVDVHSFFSFVQPKERIDAPLFGPHTGMLIKPTVVEQAINAIERNQQKAVRIFFSPHGKKLDQPLLKQIAQQWQKNNHLLLVAGRYEGMDARVEQEYADHIISIGDFVLMGGDIPAMVFMEGILRLIPGIVGKQESVEHDSFTGPFVDFPAYTEPVVWKNKEVPPVVRSGNHAAITAWEQEQAAYRTVLTHFDWLRKNELNDAQKKLAGNYIPSHYVALMHSNVLIGPENKKGTTSVTTIDIHDIARSSATYGLKNYFIVTPLIDQQKIAKKLLDFWLLENGAAYNSNRSSALERVSIQQSLEDVVKNIEQQEGIKPLIIATSARQTGRSNLITFHDQGLIWSQKRPVLFLLGTGKGLDQEILAISDYILVPIEGFADFNHLSVRSAAAIIFDRWLGINPAIID